MIPFDEDALRDDLTDIPGIGVERAAEITRVLEEHLAQHEADDATADLELDKHVATLAAANEKLSDNGQRRAFRISYASERIAEVRQMLEAHEEPA